MANENNNQHMRTQQTNAAFAPERQAPLGAASSMQPGQAARPAATDAPSHKRTILIVAGIVIAAIAIWACIWLFACNGASLFDPDARDGQAPYKSAEEMQAELDRVVEEGMFNISIASSIQFDEGTSSGTAYIENVPGNRYLMKVAITDDEFIESIVLTRDLDQGTYPATATFTALDEVTHEEVGQAAAKIAINVLN